MTTVESDYASELLSCYAGFPNSRSPRHANALSVGSRRSMTTSPRPEAAQLARRARDGTGLSQRTFAKLLGVTNVSVARWESGAVEPKGAVLALLRLVEADPERAASVLGGEPVNDP